MSEPFTKRVQALHDSWDERRQVGRLAGRHDFTSQFRLLLTLYGWAVAATADIVAVYGDELVIGVSPRPISEDDQPAFSVVIGDYHSVTFAMAERGRGMNGPHWHVNVSVASSGAGGALTAAGPERRNGQWTRTRLEDVVLSVLGAHERSLGEGSAPAARTMPFGGGGATGSVA
jgi:hypothetical protein